MNPKFNTPILLIIFNRPDKVERLIKAISEIRPTQLYISADGPRQNVKDDLEKCSKSREIIKTIDWNCEIHTNYLDKNLGVDKGMEAAMSWFFSKVDAGIICEDDCIPNRDFFTFTSELLKRYKDNEKIMLISGTNFQDGIKRGNESYYFSNYPTWGYAMWRRTWMKFDTDLSGLDQFIKTNKIDKILVDSYQKKFWINFFKKIRMGKYSFTDTRLMFSIWNSGGITIIPQTNLIKNIGFDIDATHATTGADKRSINTSQLGDIIHPETICINTVADDYFFNKIHRVSIKTKILYKINQVLTQIKRYAKNKSK